MIRPADEGGLGRSPEASILRPLSRLVTSTIDGSGMVGVRRRELAHIEDFAGWPSPSC